MSAKTAEKVLNMGFHYGERPEEVEYRTELEKKPTERVQKFLDQYYNTKHSIDLIFPYWYTRTYFAKENEGKPHVIRRALAYKSALEHSPAMIRPGELVVMQKTHYAKGGPLSPWTNNRVVASIEDDFNRLRGASAEDTLESVCVNAKGGSNVTESEGNVISISQSFGLRSEEYPALKWMCKAWEGKSTLESAYKYALAHPKYEEYLRLKDAVVAHADLETTVRHGRNVVGYQLPLQFGLNGMKARCEKELEACIKEGDVTGVEVEKAFIISIEGVQNWIKNYSKEAARLASIETDPKTKAELDDHAERLNWISENPARNFRDAMQMLHTFHTASMLDSNGSGFSIGRMGQILYPYYKKDIDAGKITREEVLEILEMHRIKCTEIEIISSVAAKSLLGGSIFSHVCLGGLKPDGTSAENELEFLILEAAIRCQTTQPTLSIFYDGRLSEAFLLKGIECNKTGCGMPAWISNQVGMDYCMETFKDEGITIQDARAWCIGGCLEAQPGAVVNGEISAGSNSSTGVSFLSAPKILELALLNGKDGRTGKQVLDAHGHKFETFEDVYEAYKEYFEEINTLYAEMFNLKCSAAFDIDNPVFWSTLTSDCIEKRRDIDHCGCRYNSTMTIWVTGFVNAVNSLASIKKNVFDDKNFTMEELLDAVQNNFGYANGIEKEVYSMVGQEKVVNNPDWERIHSLCLSAPKYGNDNPYVDDIFKDIMEYWRDITKATKDMNGNRYAPSLLAVSTHGALGQSCIADAAGRLAGVTLCDGSQSPFPGTDVNGPYAVLNSATVVNHSDFMNTQLNMKLHPASIKGEIGSRKLLDLVRNYMNHGGMHIQFNVVDSRMLQEAQKEPDNYRDLLVRVAGFTQYWCELQKPIQDEIIVRTEYEEV